MPRRGNVIKRDVLPDPMYNDKIVTRLINNVMIDGKKGVAQKIVYDAFEIIGEKTGKAPLEVFTEAMNNVMPVFAIASKISFASLSFIVLSLLWRAKSVIQRKPNVCLLSGLTSIGT